MTGPIIRKSPRAGLSYPDDAHALIERAWSRSFLARLPREAQDLLRESAAAETVPARHALFPEAPQAQTVAALVVTGLIRTRITAPSGRHVVVRYWDMGDVCGLTSILTDTSNVGVESVRPSLVVHLDPELLARLGKTEVRVASVFAEEMARRLLDDYLIGNQAPQVLGTIRARVCWHLLALAEPSGGRHIVRVTQQDLADSIGSVREVVARTLVALEREGLVARAGADLVIVDPVSLEAMITT